MKSSRLKRLVVDWFTTILILVACLIIPIIAKAKQDNPPQKQANTPLEEAKVQGLDERAELSAVLATPTLPAPVLTPFPEQNLIPVSAQSPLVEALREATILMGEGDRLYAEGDITGAREKWLAAIEAYQLAEDQLGETEAYIKLADSYQAEAMFDEGKLELAMSYYMEGLFAAAEVYETLIQKELDFDQEILAEADSLFDEGFAFFEAGDCAEAVPLMEEARALYQSIDFGGGEVRALMVKARCQAASNDFLDALVTSLEALLIAQSLPLGTPTTERFLEGKHQFEQGQYAEAKETFEEVLKQYQEAGAEAGIAQSTLDLANTYAALGDYTQAETLYQQALPMFVEQDDLYNQGATHHNLGNLYVQTSRYEEAVIAYQTALGFWQATGQPAQEVLSMSGLSLAMRAQGKYTDALAILQEAMSLQERLSPDPETEGDLLNNIGFVYYSQANYQKALEYFEQALPLQQQLPHRQKEAEALSNIATVQASLGRFDEALATYQQILTMQTQMGLPLAEATTRLNIAAVQIQQGKYQEGISTYLQMLPVFVANGDQFTEAAIHTNIGSAHLQLRDFTRAREHLKQALEIFQAIGNPEGVANTQNNLGLLALEAGDLAEAERYLENALASWQSQDNSIAAGRVLGNLALLALVQEDFNTALERNQAALEISKQAGTQTDRVHLLISRSMIYLLQPDYQAAIEQAEMALPLAIQVGDPATEMGSYLLLATAYFAREELQPAYENIQLAVDRLETLQGNITVPELKTIFIDQTVEVYTLAVLLALANDQLEQAFQFAEQARARAFLDQLASGVIDFRIDAAAPLLEQEQTLRAQIAQLRTERIELHNRPNLSEHMEAITTLDQEIAGLESEYTSLLTDLQLQSPEAAALISADAASLSDIQKELDANTTLVEYFVAGETVLAFIITRNTFELINLDTTHEELVETITAFRDFGNLTNPHPTSLQQLYTWLIAPLLPHVTTLTVFIVPHNVLHYLPFAALTDGERYFGDQYVLVNLPSASMLPFLPGKRKSNPGPLLVLGNPTISESLTPLRFAQQEAEAIADLYGVQALVNTNATESAVWAEANRSGILHLAAHGEYNELNPLFSTIHLASDSQNDGRLETHEIYGLDLTTATDLVVLSACQTQIGVVSAGDEVAGLNRAFLYAGTPSVIASLWNVDDATTTSLMEHFYRNLQAGMGKAQALQTAQYETRRLNPHPYFWAGFVLTGDGGEVKEILSNTETPGITTPIPTGPGNDAQEPGGGGSRICGSMVMPLGLIVFLISLKSRQRRRQQ